MQKIFFTVYSLALFFLFGCCASEKEKENDKPIQPPKPPTTIQENRSHVLAEVLSYYENKENQFVLKINVLELFDDGAFPSIAQLGYDYFCSPNFAINEDGSQIDNEKNQNLNQLKNISSGTKIKAEIFFQPTTGWHIDKFISIEE